MNITEEQVLSAMQTYGGGFVKQLARLYTLADPINRAKLRKCFQTEWKHYHELAELKAITQ